MVTDALILLKERYKAVLKVLRGYTIHGSAKLIATLLNSQIAPFTRYNRIFFKSTILLIIY